MRATYATLASIVALLALTYVLWGGQAGLIQDFAPELATEILGILITLVLVQRIIDRRAQDERARASRGTLRIPYGTSLTCGLKSFEDASSALPPDRRVPTSRSSVPNGRGRSTTVTSPESGMGGVTKRGRSLRLGPFRGREIRSAES